MFGFSGKGCRLKSFPANGVGKIRHRVEEGLKVEGCEWDGFLGVRKIFSPRAAQNLADADGVESGGAGFPIGVLDFANRDRARLVVFGEMLQLLAKAVGVFANEEIPLSHFSPVVDGANPALGG